MLSSEEEDGPSDAAVMVGKLKLSNAEIDYIAMEGNDLSDFHMSIASTLLKQQFPDRAGFQPTVYSMARLRPQQEGTIQFHYEQGRKHWATSMFSGNTIRYFDSMYPGHISDDIMQQLRTIYSHLMKAPTVQVIHVQQQQGTSDCSLFAIAYATHLAHSLDPAKAKFSQKDLRCHYEKCIYQKELKPFPTERTIARTARPDIISL